MVEHVGTLDFKISFVIGLGSMIVAGIFSLSGTAVAAIGSSAILAFLLAAVADGLAETAAANGGILVIGATRTRRLRRWVFGSTPDRVIDRAEGADLPVLVYASPRGVHGPIEDYVYPVYRTLTGRRRPPSDEPPSPAER